MEQVEPRITVHPARCGHHFDKDCRSCRDAFEWTDGEMERLQQATRTTDQAKDEEIARLVEAAYREGYSDADNSYTLQCNWEWSDARSSLGASNA